MNGIYYYLIAFVVIWILALSLKGKLSQHGFEIEFPIIMWKTQKLRGFISKIANLSPKFWKWYMNFGIVISFGAMVFISYLMISTLPSMFETPAVSLIIPGVEMPGSSIYVPFLSGLIALATVLIVHEFSHGIQAVCEKIPIKSIGLLLFIILPGAFVEPDEEQLNKSDKISQLRVYGAGSMANMTLAVVAIGVVMLCMASVPTFFTDDGVEITRIVSDGPSNGILKEGMIIESIGGHEIHTADDYSSFIGSFSPGDNVSVKTNQGTYTITLAENPTNHSVGYFGLQSMNHYVLSNDSLGPLPWIIFSLIEIFQWIFTLNLGIGMFNLLPIKPLDGGRMLEILLSYKLPEHQYKPLVNSLSGVFAIIIIFSLMAGFLV